MQLPVETEAGSALLSPGGTTPPTRGCAFYFLTYNAAGDSDTVWSFIECNIKLPCDCSELDPWGIVFDHATKLGQYLHFKLQEDEMDDYILDTTKRTEKKLSKALNGVKLGIERKLLLQHCPRLLQR